MTDQDLKLVSFGGNAINDGTNYSGGFKPDLGWGLPDAEPQLVKREGKPPLIGNVEFPGETLSIQLGIKGEALRTLRDQLLSWFDPKDKTPKKLVIEDEAGTGDRYKYAICKRLIPLLSSEVGVFSKTFLIWLTVHNDTCWRKTSITQDVWGITASGQTRVITNNGTADAYPIFKVKPTAAKTGGYAYKRWIPVRWRKDEAYNKYPLTITEDDLDTATLVGAGKMQADGDDLRVLIDGVEVDRWLYDINTANTKVWCNIDFQARQEATLKVAIAGAGAVDTIDVNEDISGFPGAGLLRIDSETFTYTSKNNSLKRFLGVTRAMRGTSAAAHGIGATVWWAQHDIYILYGNSTVGAPTVDDDYKPAFNLSTSTNDEWDYDDFGANAGKRTGAWTHQGLSGTPTFYFGNQGAMPDPWAEIGIMCNSPNEAGRWQLFNPCYITQITCTNGEKRAQQGDLDYFDGAIYSSGEGGGWTLEYQITDPVTQNWEPWSRDEPITDYSKYVALRLSCGANPNYKSYWLECADILAYLNSAYTPLTSIGAEQGNYSLDCIIENQTTGDKVQLTYVMELNQELELDTDKKTVIYLVDDSSQFQALTVVGGPRADWLPLRPGSNTLKFTDVGTNAVTLTTEYEERYY